MSDMGVTYLWTDSEFPPFVELENKRGDHEQYMPERTTTRNGKYKTKYGRQVPLCELCGYAIGDDRYNFCPKCGARIEDGS